MQSCTVMMASPSPSPAPNQSDIGQQAKLQDAFSYFGQVKSRFGNRPDVWDQFQDILRDSRDHFSHMPKRLSGS